MRSIIPKDKNLLRIHGIRRSHINQVSRSRSGRYSFNLVERCLRDEWLILCREINPFEEDERFDYCITKDLSFLLSDIRWKDRHVRIKKNEICRVSFNSSFNLMRNTSR